MKKLHLLLLSLTLCLFSACHNEIWDAIDGLDSRVTKLEELCKEMNTNITSLQTIVSVLQSNDFITGIVEIKKNGEVIGYTITFGKHDPITIYHGQDGKDGADGKDGQDGSANAPVIGVAQDTDGVYYWTLNGEWLLDDNGNKLPVSGKDGQNGTNGSNGQDGADGKDGQDGEDGKDGADGQDGKDGVTPQLKIEDGYWYISYDNGATWTELGKATGEDGKDGADGQDGKDGQNGADGKDGQDGDSMFQSVTQDENYVYFTLADGTVIRIARGSSNDQPNSEFIFTITYDANGGEGVMEKDTFYYGYAGKIKACTFIKEGYFFTEWNTNPNGTGAAYQYGHELSIGKNMTLYAQWEEGPYAYVDLGLSVKWATFNVGATKAEEYGEYFAWGETEPKDDYDWSTYKWCRGTEKSLTKYCVDSDWGYNRQTDNKTILDLSDDAANANWGENWRMPTSTECNELIQECTWTYTEYNEIKGYRVTSKTNSNSIFLPSAGLRSASGLQYAGMVGDYWSSSLDTDYPTSDAINLYFHNSEGPRLDGMYSSYLYRSVGRTVRPIHP